MVPIISGSGAPLLESRGYLGEKQIRSEEAGMGLEGYRRTFQIAFLSSILDSAGSRLHFLNFIKDRKDSIS